MGRFYLGYSVHPYFSKPEIYKIEVVQLLLFTHISVKAKY